MKALAQPKGEWNENEKIPETKNPEKTSLPENLKGVKMTIYTVITLGGAFVAWVEILRSAGLGQ